MHLTDKANAYSRTLSGGMKRRLLVAKAMVHSPPILVLDEPTAGVDVELRRQLWDYVRGLHAQGVTIVSGTQAVARVRLCDDERARRQFLIWHVGVAAELIGVAQAMLEASVEYAQGRLQFGKNHDSLAIHPQHQHIPRRASHGIVLDRAYDQSAVPPEPGNRKRVGLGTAGGEHQIGRTCAEPER